MLFDEAPLGCRSRKSAISPASRARCLKPAPHDPRWTDLSGFRPHRRGSLSTASGASACLGGWHRRYDMPPRAPGDARLARRDRAASAAGRGCPSLHPHSPATAACPSLATLETSLGWDRVKRDIAILQNKVNTIVFILINDKRRGMVVGPRRAQRRTRVGIKCKTAGTLRPRLRGDKLCPPYSSLTTPSRSAGRANTVRRRAARWRT